MQIKCIWQGPADLGEGPLWHPHEKVLYWIDIIQKKLYQMDIYNKKMKTWQMPNYIGSIALCKSGGLIAGIGSDICHIELPSGKIKKYITVPDGLRLNDGKCDPQGRFWIGTAYGEKPIGHLYCYTPDGKLLEKEKGIYVSNGLAWSEDCRYFYYTDSLARGIYRYDYDDRSGEIRNRELFIHINPDEGLPDGLTLDREGYLWSAFYAGGKIVRYSPDGMKNREIKLSVQRPTSCIFGGENYDILFVTSCSRDFHEIGKDHLSSPNGGLFAIDVDVSGREEFFFRDN